jgi:hypothetical protein
MFCCGAQSIYQNSISLPQYKTQIYTTQASLQEMFDIKQYSKNQSFITQEQTQVVKTRH